MNYAERVKGLAQKYGEAVVKSATSPSGGFVRADPVLKSHIALHAAIDAMQSALDDAMAKLAARDAEVERLTKALAYQKERTQQESKRVNLLGEFLMRQGLLTAEFCRPAGRETKTGGWWLLWPVYMVDKTKPPLGYGNTETEAIDAALSDEVKDDWVEYRGRDDAALDEEVKGGAL